MKSHTNIIQGTEAWHEIRYGKIGGSTSKGLFTKGDTLFYELLAEFTEPFEMDYDSFETPAMLRGHELEPRARMELGQFAGVEFTETGWLQCEEIPLLGISPDGITADWKISCELKCPGNKKHVESDLSEGILPEYIYQCIHYFTVNPHLEKHYFASYRPENTYTPLVVRVLTLDSVVNIGTNAKPVLKTVRTCVEMAKIAARELQKQIDDAIIKFQQI